MKIITNGRNRICNSAFIIGFAIAPATFAVERPAELNEAPHQLKGGTAEVQPLSEEDAQNWPEKKIAVKEALPAQPAQVQLNGAEVPYLGVGSTQIGELISEHLGIQHGVVIQQVHQGSGAAKAGLQRNDILLSFDGHQISTPLDLRDAVRGCQVGDEVAVDVIRKGQKKEEVVTLEKRPDGLPGFAPGGNLQGGMRGQLRQVWPGAEEFPEGAREQIDRLRNMIDEEFNGIGLGLKLNEMLQGDLPEGDGPLDIDMNAESSVTWSDGDGTITMKMNDGQTEVLVRDNKGDVVYDGPWETDQDKAAVAPQVRDRIENMGVQKQGNQLQLWMEGIPGQ